jgi:uncharacterized damage-inducible protein DinB
MADERYPIGKFQYQPDTDQSQKKQFIEKIAAMPRELRQAVQGMTEQQLNTPYRSGGWTVRQVVHHMADSHMNAYIRFKLAMTEDQPTIKPYNEKLWAELPDATSASVERSMALIESLHDRWTILLRSFTPHDFLRTFSHPEHGVMNLDRLLQLYAWHGRHHIAHITSVRERKK